jgi:hypothetical protein
MTIQTVTITPIGSRILDARSSIPELARVSLDKYSNNRLKHLRLVTKAFKYNFPFYDHETQRKAFAKFFTIIRSYIERMIPYLSQAKVGYLDFGHETAVIRLGPSDREQKLFALIYRYAKYITYLARKHRIPVLLITRDLTHISPHMVDGRLSSIYVTREEEKENSFNVIELRCSLNIAEGTNGYFLLYYAEEIIKVLETLHRKAHYVESTVPRT